MWIRMARLFFSGRKLGPRDFAEFAERSPFVFLVCTFSPGSGPSAALRSFRHEFCVSLVTCSKGASQALNLPTQSAKTSASLR